MLSCTLIPSFELLLAVAKSDNPCMAPRRGASMMLLVGQIRPKLFLPICIILPKRKTMSLERFSKPNIRFGSGRTGSKIVSKFRLTHNRKLRSANRNTIDHTIACPALLLWCPAVENRGPCVPKKCSLSNCASPGDSFCPVLDHW